MVTSQAPSQPSSVSERNANSRPSSEARLPATDVAAWRRADVHNLGLIALAFAGVLLLMSPERTYPVTDDWIYWQSVGDLLRLDYAPHDWTQPIALGHLAWGAAFAALFGHTFTVLTISNLVMSIACLFVFYALLRHLDITPSHALLGVAVLGFNPLYVFLTYSFMTDITFLTYMLAACLCYVRGAQGHGEWWLWLGGLGTALAYLTRQYGVLIVVAGLAYLLMSRRWTWRRAFAMAAIPIAAAVAYAVWERFQPTPLIAVQMEQVRETTLRHFDLYLTDRAFRITWMLSSLGLSLLPLVRLPRRPLILVLPFAFLAFYQFQSARIFGSLWPRNGNIVDFTGYIFYTYDAAPIWDRWVWSVLGVLGAVAVSFHAAFYAERAWAWLRARPWRDPNSASAQDAANILYALALMLAVVIFVLTPFLFDRYWLALLPALCMVMLRRMDDGRRTIEYAVLSRITHHASRFTHPWWRWGLLAPLAIFSLLAMRDYKEHASVRWQAATGLVAQGVPADHIKAGYEWDGFYAFKAGAQRIRDTHDLTYIGYPPEAVIVPEYRIGDVLDDELKKQGYAEIGSIPYRSWLDGGVERHVLLLKRK